MLFIPVCVFAVNTLLVFSIVFCHAIKENVRERLGEVEISFFRLRDKSALFATGDYLFTCRIVT